MASESPLDLAANLSARAGNRIFLKREDMQPVFSFKLRGAYTHVVHDPTELHETRPITEYYLRALEPLGVPIATRDVRLEPRPADLAEVRRFIGGESKIQHQKSNILLVHPGTRSPYRLWPAEYFAAVCDFAQDELGAQVVLTGGPGDAAALAAIRRHTRTHLLQLPDALSIGRFAALARLASAVLCHDSGPMHVATAVGTRVIALYGSQNAALFRPLGEEHVLLQPPLPCTACVAPGQCVPGDSYKNFCVRLIDPAQVKSAVRAALA